MPNNCLKSSLLNFNPTAALLSLVHLDGSYIEFSNLFVHMFINIMTCFVVVFFFPRGGQCAHIISISNSFHSQRPTSFPGPQWILHNLSLGTSHVYKTKLLGSPLTLQFSSVAQLCLTFCGPMDCSMPGFPIHHQLPEPTQNSCPSHQWCHPTISSSATPFSSYLQSFPASGTFPVSQFFTSGDQSIGVSASASVLPMNIWDWFPLGLTGCISSQSLTARVQIGNHRTDS